MRLNRRAEDIVYVLDRGGSALRIKTPKGLRGTRHHDDMPRKKNSLTGARKESTRDLSRECPGQVSRIEVTEEYETREEPRRPTYPLFPPCQPYWQPCPPCYPTYWTPYCVSGPYCPPETRDSEIEQDDHPCPDRQGTIGYADYRAPNDPEPACLLSHPISCPVPILRPHPVVTLCSPPCFQSSPEVSHTPPVRPHCPFPRDPCHSDSDHDPCHSDSDHDPCHSDSDHDPCDSDHELNDDCGYDPDPRHPGSQGSEPSDSNQDQPVLKPETVILRTNAISHPLECSVVRGGGSIHVWGSANHPDLSIEALQGTLELPFPSETRTVYGQLTVFNDIVASSYQGVVVSKKDQLRVVFSNKPIVPIGIPMKGSVHFNLLMSD